MIHVAENGRGLFTSSVRALGCAALLLLHLDPGSCRAPIGCARCGWYVALACKYGSARLVLKGGLCLLQHLCGMCVGGLSILYCE